ncbi:MAG: hypothetical protein C4294_09185 [Nitrospiraceae bacterium]
MIASQAWRRKAAGLIAGFAESVERFPSRPALQVGGESFTYADLGRIAGRIAATIGEADPGGRELVAVLAQRSVIAYASVLGVLGAGRGYVPLNPKLPIERLLSILRQSPCTCLLVGRESVEVLRALLPNMPHAFTILLPDLPDAEALPSVFTQHRFIFSDMMAQAASFTTSPNNDGDPIAYLLFTSGSTGTPKGVPVRHSNVFAYVDYICRRYRVNEYDRFSQMFDLTFDLSVHDMFVCWERGACLCSVPEKSVMAPAKFIKDHQITMWFSVPSVVGFMSKMGLLKPGEFPSLRGSLFCGEPLHRHYAEAWQEAAPNSFVENLYGPTETTVAITHYRWSEKRSPSACVNGIVPIGWVFDGQRTCIVDADLHPVQKGERGELCLSGSQVTRGYWNDPDQTAHRFVRLPGFGQELWYRTGDLVRQDEGDCLYYCGRIDHQVKIRGCRVKLQEIDFVLSQASGTQEVASIAWPIREGIAEGIVSFICDGSHLDARRLLQHCRRVLPEHMVPRRLYFVDALPLNVHGKIDRLKLRQMLENGDHGSNW